MTKHDLLEEYIDNMSDDDLYSLWNDCASESGKVDYIELTDSIDEIWTPTKILECDLDDFNIRDEYYIIDNFDSLVSFDWVREAVDYMEQTDNLIDWLLETEYDGWNDELKEFMDSEEYKEAE